jgi:hydroxypyruvate reductase
MPESAIKVVFSISSFRMEAYPVSRLVNSLRMTFLIASDSWKSSNYALHINMLSSTLLHTFTLSNHLAGKEIAGILAAGLNAVDPYQSVKTNLIRENNVLHVGNQTIDLNKINRIFAISVGKAALPMTAAIDEIVGNSTFKAVAITKEGHSLTNLEFSPNIQIIEAGHPLPNQKSIIGAQRVIKLLSEARSDDLIICSISGGGSALMTSPKPGIRLDEVQNLTSQLLACGATIDEINTIRKHIDQVKGRRPRPVHPVVIIMSDVIGDPIDRCFWPPARSIYFRKCL